MSKRVSAPPTEQLSIQPPPVLTWSHLLGKFMGALEDESKEKQKSNFKTASKFFLTSIGLAESSPVGVEFGDEFEAKIQVFTEFEAERGLTGSTYGPRVSKIRELKRFAEVNFAESLRVQALPQTFGQKLRKLITSLGFTAISFWRTLPKGLVSYKVFRHWCYEYSSPFQKHLEAIKTIETHLHVPHGTLRINRYHNGEHHLKVGQTDFGNKLRATSAKSYGVWTPLLQEEFQKFVIHKTAAILPDGEERHKKGQWTRNEDASIPSANVAKAFLRSFMGFCALPQDNPDPYLRGGGIKLEELSLALLADKELVENYLEFKKLRSGLRVRPIHELTAALPEYEVSSDGKWEFYDKGGKYHNGSIRDLACISSLLRPGTGYLYQHPEFAEKLGLRMTAASWGDQCVRTRSRVDKLCRDISALKNDNDQENFDFGRDPKERIESILESPRPLLVLHEMLKEMLADLLPDGSSIFERALQYRDITQFALLSANPLRVHMLSIMEFDKHLVRLDDGSWRLRFKRGAFKNRKSLKSNYDVGVARGVWPILDRYREEFHPVLAGSTRTRHVFIGHGAGLSRQRWGAPLSTTSLSQNMEKLTERYAPSGMGFSSHAFRHIVATDIIKIDPRIGFFLAAIALHDKLETVEREYIHLKTSEFFEPVNTHFNEAWSQVFG